MKRLLFVCVENSCRSQIAEAFARIHGKGMIEVYSAGSRPSGKVNPKAIEAMREVGYDLAGHVSKSLAEIPAVEFCAAFARGADERHGEPRFKGERDERGLAIARHAFDSNPLRVHGRIGFEII